MKRLIVFVMGMFLMTTAAFAVTVGDKMTFEGPVTFKGTISTAAPNAAGTIGTNCVVSHNHGTVAGTYTLTAAENQCSYFVFTNFSSTTTSAVIKPASTPGKHQTVYNNSGKTLTFKVTGQTGATIANGKKALYVDNGTDVVEIYEIP